MRPLNERTTRLNRDRSAICMLGYETFEEQTCNHAARCHMMPVMFRLSAQPYCQGYLVLRYSKLDAHPVFQRLHEASLSLPELQAWLKVLSIGQPKPYISAKTDLDGNLCLQPALLFGPCLVHEPRPWRHDYEHVFAQAAEQSLASCQLQAEIANLRTFSSPLACASAPVGSHDATLENVAGGWVQTSGSESQFMMHSG